MEDCYILHLNCSHFAVVDFESFTKAQHRQFDAKFSFFLVTLLISYFQRVRTVRWRYFNPDCRVEMITWTFSSSLSELLGKLQPRYRQGGATCLPRNRNVKIMYSTYRKRINLAWQRGSTRSAGTQLAHVIGSSDLALFLVSSECSNSSSTFVIS